MGIYTEYDAGISTAKIDNEAFTIESSNLDEKLGIDNREEHMGASGPMCYKIKKTSSSLTLSVFVPSHLSPIDIAKKRNIEVEVIEVNGRVTKMTEAYPVGEVDFNHETSVMKITYKSQKPLVITPSQLGR